MNEKIQTLQNLIQDSDSISESEKTAIASVLKDVDKILTVTEFKLDRTEKVKRTTAILLEETIDELELKRKAIEETNVALQK